MSERIDGDLEIRDAVGKRYDNVIGSSINPAVVPDILEGVHHIAGATEVEPEPVGTITPAAQWTATGPDGVTVTIKLWRKPVYDETFAGQIGAALAAEQGGTA